MITNANIDFRLRSLKKAIKGLDIENELFLS